MIVSAVLLRHFLRKAATLFIAFSGSSNASLLFRQDDLQQLSLDKFHNAGKKRQNVNVVLLHVAKRHDDLSGGAAIPTMEV